MSNCIAYICVASPQNEWASVFSNLKLGWIMCRNCTTYPENGWVNAFFKCPAFANDLLQCAHLCNFSPVWIIMWRLDNQIWMNFRKTSKGGGGVFKSGYPSVPKMTKTNKHLLHCMHLCDFFPEWNERICNYSDFQLGQILSCIDQFSTAVGRH